jgi:hypothetical protein
MKHAGNAVRGPGALLVWGIPLSLGLVALQVGVDSTNVRLTTQPIGRVRAFQISLTRQDTPSQLTQGSVAVKRPGTGLPPSMLGQVLGKIAERTIPEGTPLTLEMLR